MIENCGQPAKQPIAADLMEKFRNLADRAHDLAQRTAGKLEPVMRKEVPMTEEGGGEVQEQYPPLFDDYRTSLQGIEDALMRIDNCLRRCEL